MTGASVVLSSAGGYEAALGNPGRKLRLVQTGNIGLTEAQPIHEITGAIDTLVIAGGPGAETGSYDPGFVAWIADAAKRSRRIVSICTGTFLLGAAGLIDGRKVVTHWKFCDRLATEFPHARVHPEPTFLQDGPITLPLESLLVSTWFSLWLRRIRGMSRL